MMKTQNFDVHVHDVSAPHVHSEDCWCEPSRAYWVEGKDGKPLHVLEHNDHFAPWPQWVTACLDSVGKD